MKGQIAMFASLERFAVAARAWNRRRQAINELSVLSDRTFKDMGLHRSQIRSLVDVLDRPDQDSRTRQQAAARGQRKEMRWQR